MMDVSLGLITMDLLICSYATQTYISCKPSIMCRTKYGFCSLCDMNSVALRAAVDLQSLSSLTCEIQGSPYRTFKRSQPVNKIIRVWLENSSVRFVMKTSDLSCCVPITVLSSRHYLPTQFTLLSFVVILIRRLIVYTVTGVQ